MIHSLHKKIRSLYSFFTECCNDPNMKRPGYIKLIPYLAIMRFVIYIGVPLRFLFHEEEYSSEVFSSIIILTIVALLYAFAAIPKAKYNTEREMDRQRVIGYIDILFISLFYFLTRTLESDFFIFYSLPILAIAVSIEPKYLLRTGGLVTMAFLSVLVFITLTVSSSKSIYKVFFGVFLPRELFIVLMVVVATYLRRLYTANFTHVMELEEILKYRVDINGTLSINEVLDTALRTAVETTSVPGGFIWLNNEPNLRDFISISNNKLTTSSQVLKSFYEIIEHDYCGMMEPPNEVYHGDYKGLIVPITAQNRILGALGVITEAVRKDTMGISIFLKALAAPVGYEIERIRLENAMAGIVRISSGVIVLNRHLDSILDEIVVNRGFDYAAIGLVDEYMDQIDIIRARNMSPRQIKDGRVSLTSNEISAEVARIGQTKTFFSKREAKALNESFKRMYTGSLWTLPVCQSFLAYNCKRIR